MIAALVSRWAAPIAVIAALLGVAGLGAWRAVAGVQSMVAAAADTAKAERDAHWRAEIAAANAQAAQAEADQARAAMAADATMRAAETARENALKDLEMRNAALADGDRRCLGRGRVRLLNEPR